MASPLHQADGNDFRRLGIAVAPERVEDYEALIADIGVRFTVDHDEPVNGFWWHQATRTICAGVEPLERIWASAYAGFAFDAEMTKQGVENKGQVVVIEPAEVGGELEQARRLLSWAATEEVRLRTPRRDGEPVPPREPYLDGLPQPFVPGPGADINAAAAGEAALLCMGFFLHHELAHARLSHSPPTSLDPEPEESTRLVRDEHAADMAAAEWMTSGAADDPDLFLKRSMGVAQGLLWIAFPDAYIQARIGGTHPSGYDRIWKVLNALLSDPDHPTWRFVMHTLYIHLQGCGRPFNPGHEHETQRDLVRYCLDQFALPRVN